MLSIVVQIFQPENVWIGKCHAKLQAIPVVGPGFIKGDAINSPCDVILGTRVLIKDFIGHSSTEILILIVFI